MHGLGVSHRYFVPLGEQLAPYYSVYIPDLPGFGKSTKPAHALTIRQLSDLLSDFMGTLPHKKIILLGNSFGCQVIVDCLARFPEKAAAAILAGPTVDVYARTKRQQVKAWFKNSKYEKPSQTLPIIKDYADCGVRRFVETFGYALADKIEEKLPRVTVPVLVVRGGNDKVVSQKWAEDVTSRLPQGRLVIVSGKGHTVNYNAPQQLARITKQFTEDMS